MLSLTTKRVQVSFYLPESTVSALKAEAAKKGIPWTRFLRDIIEDWAKANPPSA